MAMRLAHYYSSGCVHEVHTLCDLVCDICGEPCRCECHEEKVPAVTVQVPA